MEQLLHINILQNRINQSLVTPRFDGGWLVATATLEAGKSTVVSRFFHKKSPDSSGLFRWCGLALLGQDQLAQPGGLQSVDFAVVANGDGFLAAQQHLAVQHIVTCGAVVASGVGTAGGL